MKCIIGTKQGMTQIFREDGTVVPVTRVQAGPCTITQVKTKEKDGVNSIQVGFGTQKKFRINRAQQGHLNGLPDVRVMKEFRTTEAESGLERGTTFTVTTFEPGDKVSVTGTSKGKGFQGVVKRHKFAGAISTHGTKDQVRMPGSIGATGPARVFKGMRMGGHMGAEQTTVQNLEIVAIDEANNELLIKGAVPGAKGGYLYIHTAEGTITPMVVQAPAEAVPAEETDAPATTEAPAEETAEATQGEAEATADTTDAVEPSTEESTEADTPEADEAPAAEATEEKEQ